MRRLILRSFAGVQKELLIAFGSGEAAGLETEDLEAGGFGGAAHGFRGTDVQLFFSDYSARADVFAAEFELGFYEDEEFGICAGGGDGGR
jgi:hypothetical protein